MKTKAKKSEKIIDVVHLRQETIAFCVVGKTPLILNRLSQKVIMELLLPSKRKNQSERQSIAKHDPIAEFRSAPDTVESGPTLLAVPATAFKGALRSVAVDMPGSSKAQMGRLCYIGGSKVGIFGIPKLHMTPVRNSGMNRTPDVRTRAIVENWAAVVNVNYTVPILTESTISTLFQAAGIINGIGDWRPEKGNGNYGTFHCVNPEDTEFMHILETGGRDAQAAAMLKAEPFDAETEELLSWFIEEAGRRDFKIAK